MKTLQRIICVDDEPDMRMIIRLSLENIGGFEVTAYASGQELLDDAGHLNPDLIILDAVMPGIDGVQTLARMKEAGAYKGVPVLFMTGKAKEAEAELMQAGAIGVVMKPFDPIHLATDVKEIWNKTQND